MFVCFLTGKHVFQNCTNVCTINTMDKLDKVRAYVKRLYNVEFEDAPNYKFNSAGYKVYENKTDNRDIKLVIESVTEL